ncbi:MAG TPA: aminodeoxychorismate/anthranilate synthase component II [Acidobacteriota bacterium]
MILVIDNYDSFTYNLVQALGTLGAEIEVRRNDQIDAAGVVALAPAAIVMSPGPGRPEDSGCCREIIAELGAEVPILGVCLGHQAIAAVLGGVVIRSPAVVHGKTARIEHCGEGIFAGLPQPLEVARYHSLIVQREGLPDSLEITAWTADGLIMAMRHREWPLQGVQFHPESIATPEGPAMLKNFLEGAGMGVSGADRESDVASRTPRSATASIPGAER